MIALLAVLLLPGAQAGEDTRLFTGPGAYAASFAPLALGQYQSSQGGGAVTGGTTLIGVGFGTRVSLLTLILNPEQGLFPADFIGFDLVVGGRTNPDSGAWVIARGDAGFGLVLRSDDIDIWIRAGAYLGMDTGFGTGAFEASWVLGLGTALGPLFVELVPGLGAQLRVSQARVLVDLPNSIFSVGILGEHLAERDYPRRRASTRGMALLVMR